MFEAYKIGVKIGVIDATAGSILKIAAQFTKAQKEANSFLETLKKINAELGKGPKTWAGQTADDFDRATRSAGRYEQAARRAASASSRGSAVAGFLGAEVGAMASSSGAMRLPGPGASSGALLALPGGGGALPPNITRLIGSNNPLYRNSGASVLRAAGRGWGGFGGGGNGGRGGGFNVSGFMGGLAETDIGLHILGSLHSPIEQASAYQQAQARFKQYGLSDEQNASAFAFAKAMKTPGTDYTHALDYLTEAQGVFRESGLAGEDALRGAKLAAPLLAQMSFAASSLDDESQARMHTQELAALRFNEMRGGLTSPEKFNANMNAAWKAIRSSGGNVDFEQYRQFMARGGIAAQGITNDALYGELEPIIGELKGSTAGFGLRTSYNRMTGVTRVPNQVAHMLADSGIWDASKIVWNSQGGIKQFKGNPLRDADMRMMTSDPVKFFHDVIMPAYRRIGIKDDDSAAIGRENALLFGSNGGQFYNLINRQYQQTQDSLLAQRKTKDIAGASKDAEQTYAGNLKDFNAAWHDFQINFGNAALPMITQGLRIVTPMLKSAAEFLGAHSTLTKGLVIALGAFGALATVAGGLTMAAAAIGGLGTILSSGALVAGAGALATVLGSVAALAAAGVVGAKVGGYISKHYVEGTKAGDAIGSGIAHVAAFFGSKEAQDAIDANNKASALLSGPGYGSPQAGKTIQVNSNLYLTQNGMRVIAQGVTTHQVGALNAPQTGMSGVDSSLNGMPVGLGRGF